MVEGDSLGFALPDSTTGKGAGSSDMKGGDIAIVCALKAFLTEDQKERTRAVMRSIAASNSLPGTSARIQFADEYPAMAPTPANDAILAVYDSASQALGYGPVAALDPSQRGAGDISFVAPLIPGLVAHRFVVTTMTPCAACGCA